MGRVTDDERKTPPMTRDYVIQALSRMGRQDILDYIDALIAEKKAAVERLRAERDAEVAAFEARVKELESRIRALRGKVGSDAGRELLALIEGK
jgi:hypothetical protein